MIRQMIAAVMAAMIFFSGCQTLSPEPETDPAAAMPERFAEPLPVGDVFRETGSEGWSPLFNNDEFTRLIQTAMKDNYQLVQLKARIAQEEAKLKIDRAGFFPGLSFSLGGEKKETRIKKSGKSSSRDGSHSWDASLSSSYSPDIWNKLSATQQAQVLNLSAAVKDLSVSRLDICVQVAHAWIDILASRQERKILEQQVKINQTLLELQTLRFRNGQADALDVSQQRESLAEANSQLPLAERDERQAMNLLAFLTGQSGSSRPVVLTESLPEPLPLPDPGIPSDLLENRPDIQAARLRLASSKQAIMAARAARLPSFTLTAQAVFSSGNLDLLFKNWVATLAAALSGPIFDGGLKKAEIEQARAVAEEKAGSYAETVYSAIREVEDTLVGIEKQHSYIRLLEDELSVARLTLKDAMVQYRNGQSSYLSYLVAWNSIERLERQLVKERANFLKERINLYKALGRPAGLFPGNT